MIRYYIHSRKAGTKKWCKHIPGYEREETALNLIESFKFHGNADREYMVKPESYTPYQSVRRRIRRHGR
jgi:hypothetical protein